MAARPAVKPEAKADAAAPAAPAAPSKRAPKKLIAIVAAGVLLLAGGGAAAYFALGNRHEPAETKRVPVFVELETFTVNLREPDDDRFMQVKLVAEVKDSASSEALKSMMPAVRNEILLLLGSKQAQDISTREGKQTLAQEIVVAVNKTLAGTPAEKSVQSVNFTHLIVQ